jgi:hypothetical protein
MPERKFEDLLRGLNNEVSLAETLTRPYRHPSVLSDSVFMASRRVALVLFVVLFCGDYAFLLFSLEGSQTLSMLLGSLPLWVRWIIVGGSVLLFATVLYDLLTSRPLILRDNYYEDINFSFIRSFHVDSNVEICFLELKEGPPESSRGEIQHELNIFVTIWNYIRKHNIRKKVVTTYIELLSVLICSLTLLIYLLNMTGGWCRFAGLEDKPLFMSHLYFTVVTFFTIGFGDISPKNDSFGQVAVIITAFSSIMSLYVGLGVFLSGLYSMRINLRSAVRSFVVSNSRL